ncbi:Contactin-3 [Labeo rohita]|uniref:Contactin-3 n=1 Tax=Labeo rohita TaxID=84645 RepID=A0ABQ8LXE9_LABRO|nr:Contactin-3 [Labeo rohita]
MADKCCLLGLIILCSFLRGSEVDDPHVFCSSGENVRLPCNNALSDCTSTTWNYNRNLGTVELIKLGIKNEIERRERLSVGSDCSLNIKKVTKEDYGSYTCRQYVNGQQQGTDARVYLHFLHVSSSSSQTEISPGSSVTLSCQLYYYGVSCDTLVRTEGIQLIWVNQAGVNLQTDARYQILFSSTNCIITLTTTLLNEDHNREWRCQVKQRNEQKTSATYTVKYSDYVSNSKDPSTTKTDISTQAIIISAVVAVLAVVLVAVLSVICKKRPDNQRGTDGSVVKDQYEHKGTYETINMFIPTTPNTNEQTDDVTYTEVTASSKKQVQIDNVSRYSTTTFTCSSLTAQ